VGVGIAHVAVSPPLATNDWVFLAAGIAAAFIVVFVVVTTMRSDRRLRAAHERRHGPIGTRSGQRPTGRPARRRSGDPAPATGRRGRRVNG